MPNERPRSDPNVALGSAPFARLTREVLDRLAAPEVRDAIVRDALGQAGLTAIPEDAAGFGAFACGALRDAVEQVLGPDEASAVLSDLSPAFAHEGGRPSSGVRRRKRASLAAPTEGAPIVLVATADAAAADALTVRLKQRAKVIVAFDVLTLLAAATQPSIGTPTVLLNDDMPGLRPSTLATLARVLPAGVRILVWGRAQLEPERRGPPAPVEWVHMGPVEDVDAVADLCIAMWPSLEPDEPDEPPLTGRRRVLIAHHDATWRAHVTRLLNGAGYDVTSAPDGFIALERCVEDAPSAVIAAYAMDTIDGPQLASLLAGRFGEDAPPVFLVASLPLPEPPLGARAVISNDAVEEDLIPELAAWLRSG